MVTPAADIIQEVYDTTDKAIKTKLVSGDIEIGKVEIKNSTDDATAVVKSDGTNNALVVVQNTVPTTTVTGSVNVGTVTTLPAITGSVSVSNMIPAVETGLATSAKQLANGHDVTVDNASAGSAVNIQDGGNTITVDGAVTATVSATNLDIRDLSSTTDSVEVKQSTAGNLKTEALPYTYNIVYGNVSGKTPWTRIGWNGTVAASTEATLWSATGTYVFPLVADGWQVLSASTADGGVSIFNGTSTGGSATTLIDTGKTFNAGTAVEIGDCIILDKAMDGGRTPEWGFVTGVAANTLTVAGGFSSGGTGSGRVYYVLNKNDATGAAKTGAQAVKIEYLDGSYNAKTEIVILAANTTQNTVNTDMFRVNSFRVIATGSGNKPVAALTLRLEGGAATVYSYISAGMTRSRSVVYTVPLGKTLFLTNATFGFGVTGKANNEYGRFITRANIEPSTGFNSGSVFYPFAEMISFSNQIVQSLDVPAKYPAKTDMIVSIITTEAGVAACTLRGWLE